MRNPRSRFLLLILAFCSALSFGQNASPEGMHYYFVLLLRPANAPQLSKDEGEKLQQAHLANIRKLHQEHKLYVAGPFLDDTVLRGIFVFKATSTAQVQDWTSTDPAIKAGRLAPEIHGPWLIDSDAIHAPATPEGMEQYTLVLLRNAANPPFTPVSAVLERQNAEFLARNTENGNIAVAGNFAPDSAGDLRAVIIFRHKPDDSIKILNDDPLVKNNTLKLEIHPWATGKGVLPPGEPLQLQ
jgi:uncharacterized protein YciI